MARAMWKASLAIGPNGDDELPVKLYSAVADRDVHLHLLHARDEVPVKQQMVESGSHKEVSGDAVRRGFEVEPGVFVILTEQELAAEAEPSRTIEIIRFVPTSSVDPSWYRRPYMLGPDGDDAGYFALVRALQNSERVGIARWVMREQRYTGALSVRGDHLALIVLHDASDVVTAADLERPGGPAVGKGERHLAEQLISALDAPFQPEKLHDEYRERVRAFIEARAAGREMDMPKETPVAARADLAAALRESLQAAKERRVA